MTSACSELRPCGRLVAHDIACADAWIFANEPGCSCENPTCVLRCELRWGICTSAGLGFACLCKSFTGVCLGPFRWGICTFAAVRAILFVRKPHLCWPASSWMVIFHIRRPCSCLVVRNPHGRSSRLFQVRKSHIRKQKWAPLCEKRMLAIYGKFVRDAHVCRAFAQVGVCSLAVVQTRCLHRFSSPSLTNPQVEPVFSSKANHEVQ